MPAPQFRTYQSPGCTAEVARTTPASDPYPEYRITAQAHFKAEDGETYHGIVFVGRVVKDFDPWPTVKWYVEDNPMFPEKYRTIKEVAQVAMAEARAHARLKAFIANMKETN